MKNSSISSTELELRIRKVTGDLLLLNLKEEHRTRKASPYNTHNVDEKRTIVGERYSSQKFYFLLAYLVLFHFYPIDEKHYFYCYVDLQEHILKNPNTFWVSVLLENKDYFILWLVEQQTITESAFFGNICNVRSLTKAMNSITILFEKSLRHPKRVQRHRGYRDKGSLPSDSLKAIREEESKDIFISLAHYRIEEQRELRHLEVRLLREHFSEGRILSDEHLVKFKFIRRKEIQTNERNTYPENPDKRGTSSEDDTEESESRGSDQSSGEKD